MKQVLVLAVVAWMCILACSCGQKRDEDGLRYDMQGRGRTAVVFLHGWCIDRHYWDDQVAYLKDRYVVIAVDLAGHGQSNSPIRDVRRPVDYAADVVALLRSLELERVVLVGHSMSGTVMLYVRNQIPDRVVGLIGVDNFKDAGAKMNDEQKRQIEAFLHSLKSDYEGTVREFGRAFLFSPSTDSLVVQRVLASVMGMDRTKSIGTLEALFADTSERVLLQQIPVPFVLINSDQPPTDEAMLDQWIPSPHRVYYIRGSGHYPMIEKPGDFNRALDSALSFIGS